MESSFEDNLVELEAVNTLIIIGVIAHLQELGPGIPLIVEGGAGDAKTAEDECLLLLLNLLLAESDVCVSEDQVVLIIVYHCFSWLFPHVVGLAVCYAEDEAPAWLLDGVFQHWADSETTDFCAVGEMNQHEKVGDAIDVLMEVGGVERIEPMDQSGCRRYLLGVSIQGFDHPTHAFPWDDQRTVEELGCSEAGYPLAQKHLNLLLQFVAFVGAGSLEQDCLSGDLLRGFRDHHFVDIINNSQRFLVVFFLPAEAGVEAGNI